MRRFLLVLIALVGLIGVILSLIMLVTAIRFNEFGRVILYFTTLLICGEMSVIAIIKLWCKKDDIS